MPFMFSQVNKIDAGSFVSEIVRYDYRTADLFGNTILIFAVAANGHWMSFAKIKTLRLKL